MSCSSSAAAAVASVPVGLRLRVSDDHGIVATLTARGWEDVAGFAFSPASVEALDAFARGRTRYLVIRMAGPRLDRSGAGRDVVTCANPRLIAVW